MQCEAFKLCIATSSPSLDKKKKTTKQILS